MNYNDFTIYRKFLALIKYIDLITENKDVTFSYCSRILITKVLCWISVFGVCTILEYLTLRIAVELWTHISSKVIQRILPWNWDKILKNSWNDLSSTYCIHICNLILFITGNSEIENYWKSSKYWSTLKNSEHNLYPTISNIHWRSNYLYKNKKHSHLINAKICFCL